MIFWQTLSVFDYFGCVLLIFELRNKFWSILRRIFGPKVKNAIFPCQKWHFWAKFGFICGFWPKYASMCLRNVFQGLQGPQTHPNMSQIKQFALKHHQIDFKRLFWKVKILHFFQNFNFQKWEFSFSFSAGNGSWKSPPKKMSSAKKSRFSNRDMVFGQTLLD